MTTKMYSSTTFISSLNLGKISTVFSYIPIAYSFRTMLQARLVLVQLCSLLFLWI